MEKFIRAAARDKFKLRQYYIDAFEFFISQADFEGKAVLEVGGSSLPREFVLDVLGAKRWVAVDILQSTTGLYQLRENHEHYETIPIVRLPLAEDANVSDGEYIIIDGDAAELPQQFFNKFGLIVSVNALEHILQFPRFTRTMLDCLKPGGVFMSQHGPVWSGSSGSHFWIDQNFNFTNQSPLPDWAHLLMRPGEMYDFLLAQGKSHDVANRTVSQTYFSPRINRLFFDEYQPFFEKAGFTDVTVMPRWEKPLSEPVCDRFKKLYPWNTNLGASSMRLMATRP